MLSLPRASQSLVRELRPYMPCSSANKVNKSKSAFPLNFQKMISIIYPNYYMQWSGINPFLPPGNLPPHLLHFHSNEKSLQKTLVFIKIFFQWNVTTLNTSSSVFVCRLWILYTYVFVLSHPSNLHVSLLVSLFSIPYWFNKFNPTSISWMPNATVSRSDPQSSPALRPTIPFGLTPLLFFNILNTSLPQGVDFAALSSKISSSLFCRFPQVSFSEIKKPSPDHSLSISSAPRVQLGTWQALSKCFLNGFCCYVFSSVQSLSRVQLFVTPWTAARQAALSITISWSLLKLMSIESVMTSNHLILCRPLLLLPSIFPSIRVFSNESVLHIRWPKYWSFSFSISPSNDWFPLGLTGLISLQSNGLSRVFSSTTVQKH